MGAVKFFNVLTVADEVVKPDPAWVRDVYTPVACPVCRDVLPQLADRAMDIDVVEEPRGPSATVEFPISLELMRTDFFGALQPHMPEFFFGSVRAGGRRLPRYVSVFAGEGARLLMYGDDERSRYSSCRRCGRENERMVVGKRWFKREDVGDRLVFTSSGGIGLYVAKPLLDGLPPGLRRELRLFPIGVRP